MTAGRSNVVGVPTVRHTPDGGVELQLPTGAWHRVHAAGHPAEEARVWLADALRKTPDAAAVCVIGAGAGWVVEAAEALEHPPALLVFEPEPLLTLEWFARRDVTALIEAGRLMVLTGPAFAGAATAWRALGRIVSDPPLLIHQVIAVARRDTTVAAARLAKRAFADAQANEHARRRFATPYLLNTLRNVPALTTESDVSALFDAYHGMPVVVAAAGPSLNRNLEELRPWRDRVVLVAADTALRPTLAAGLAPDFVVAVDPGAANARHLTGLPPCEGTCLVAEPSVQRSSLHAFRGRTYFFRVAPHHPWPWLGTVGIEVATLRAWGSVLVTALDFAVRLGGDPVVLIGADLAYTNGQPYCRGTVYEDDWAARVATGERLEEIWAQAIAMHTPLVESFGAEQVQTAPHLAQFRDGVLAAIRQASTTVINATGAGILRDPNGPTGATPGRGSPGWAALEHVLRERPPLTRRPLPRRPVPPSAVDAMRALAARVVQRTELTPAAWGRVFAETEPPDPTIGAQCTEVAQGLADWVGVPLASAP